MKSNKNLAQMLKGASKLWTLVDVAGSYNCRKAGACAVMH